jgi:hypothetical protein
LEDRVFDQGLILTAQAIRRQLAAMPHELYLIRLIHQPSQRPFPGERLWTAQQLLTSGMTVAQATAIYQTWMRRWRIAERFASPVAQAVGRSSRIGFPARHEPRYG